MAKKIKEYLLQDVEEPQLYREVFPYSEVPRIILDGKSVPLNLPDSIWITDTTFRDGQQSRPPYKTQEIIDLFDMMHLLDGGSGIIRASEFFLYSKKDKEAVEQCLARGYEFPEVTGWIRAVKSDFKLVKQMGLQETGILTSASDYHIFLKLRKSRREALESYLDVVRDAVGNGIRVRCHLEDITRADVYGFCVPFAQELMKLTEESGVPIKLRLCDTMGYGISHSGVELPRSIPKLIRAMIKDAGVPPELLEWHGHNDFHRVHVNSVTAWLYGCSGINASLLGFGERTGNSPLEGLVMEYLALKGPNPKIDTTVITAIANYFRDQIGAEIPDNYPFVGGSFNTTRAGIHADGVIKNEEIYNIFDTTEILRRPLGIQITDKSGIAGIAHWVNEHKEIQDSEPVDKRHPGINRMYKAITQEYDAGRTTSISNEEMHVLALKFLPEYFQSDFDRLKVKAREMASDLIAKLMENSDIQSMDRERIRPVLEQELQNEPFTQLIAVVNTTGKVIYVATHIVDTARIEKHLGTDFSDREWFINPMKNGRIAVSNLYASRHTGQLCITVSAPVCRDDGEIIGVIELDIRFEELVKVGEF